MTSRYCSRPCAWANNGGRNKKPEVWWTDSKGYVQGRVWEVGKQRRVKKHRYLVEQQLGRKLLPSEDVHHLNEDKSDNDLGNLQHIDHGEHARLHNQKREYKRGYRLKISDAERAARSARMKTRHAARALLSKLEAGR